MSAAIASQPPRLIGKLMVTSSRGFGFLRVEGSEIEYFLHKQEVKNRDRWKLYRKVEFTPAPPRHGGTSPRAIDAVVVDSAHAGKSRA